MTHEEPPFLRGSPSEGFDTRFGIAAFQVVVVSMELCESLLNQSRPKTISIFSADLGENSSQIAIFNSASYIAVHVHQGEVVVDDDLLGDSEAIELDAIDASFVQFVLFVHEEVVDATRFGSKGRAGGQEPAVSEHRLVNVGRRDGISEESLFWEHVSSTLPRADIL